MSKGKKVVGRVLFRDEKSLDLVALIITFKRQVKKEEWPKIHRDLQRQFKANFPYWHRREMKLGSQKYCYRFLGFKITKTK